MKTPEGITINLNVHGFARLPGKNGRNLRGPRMTEAGVVVEEEVVLQGEIVQAMNSSEENATQSYNMSAPAAMGRDRLKFLTSAGSITVNPNGALDLDNSVAEFLAATGVNVPSEKGEERKLLFTQDCWQNPDSCSQVQGNYRVKKQSSCKYGHPAVVQDACKLYCEGFTSRGYSADFCFKGSSCPHQCEHTSEKCAPLEGQYCCCFNGGSYYSSKGDWDSDSQWSSGYDQWGTSSQRSSYDQWGSNSAPQYYFFN